MRIATIGAMALALTGCTTSGTPDAPPASGAACDAARADGFVGRDGAAIAEEARIAAGARSVRVIAPGQPVTMDYRPDRLNLETDAAGKVTKARCG